jgi:PAS domain S-box-containing protein
MSGSRRTSRQRGARRQRTDEAQERLAAIVDSSSDAIISKTPDGVITSWNPAAERMFGWTAAEAIGQPITLIIPPDRRAEEAHVLAHIRRGERVEHFETVRVAKDGRRIDVSLTVTPIRNARRRVIGASKSAREITERRRFEEDRDQLLARAHEARQAAEAANRAKDEFLAMLGHELRNPLGVIMTGVTVLERSNLAPPDAVQVRTVIRRQAEHLARLLDDLLDVSRITRGKIDLRRQPLDVRPIVEVVLQSEGMRFADKGHRLEVALPEAPVFVHADPARLQQIIGNLLNNAAKYTPAGGAIALTVRCDGGDAVIQVDDTGRGIPPGRMQSIFKLFSRLDAGRFPSEAGLGVGLFLAKRLVEMHEGSIEAHSEGTDRGSRFTVRLPLAPVPAAAVDRPPTAHPVCAGHRILVVEDNADARELLRLGLELQGQHVAVAADGTEGVSLATARQPDVVLIDIGLPGLDGYEVACRIREELGSGPLLVALTGYGEPEDRRRSREAGFDAHLTKPVTVEQILRLLARDAKRPIR